MSANVSASAKFEPPLLGHLDYAKKPVAVVAVRATFYAYSKPRLDFDAVAIKKDGTLGNASRTLSYGSLTWETLPAETRQQLTRDALTEIDNLQASVLGTPAGAA